MIGLALVVILVVTGIVKYVLHMRHMESYVKNLPNIAPFYPFIGTSFELIGKTATEAFCEVMNILKKRDAPFKMYLGPILAVISDRPEDCKAVLTSQIDKPYIYTFLNISNGENNLLTSVCKFVIQDKKILSGNFFKSRNQFRCLATPDFSIFSIYI